MAISNWKTVGYICLVLSSTALFGHANAQSCGADCPYYSLAFSDEFNADSVDETVWNYREDIKSESTQLPANVDQSGGYMNIHLKEQTIGATNYTGGGLISKSNFHYGYYEARMAINNGAGFHTSFWAVAGNGSDTADNAFGSWTELDVFEIDSVVPTKIRNNIFEWYTYDGTSHGTDEYLTSGIYNTSDDFRDFHDFGALWNETGVTFYIDGKVNFTQPYAPSTWVHDYVNIWLTCIAYNGEDNGVTPDNSMLPSVTLTDYVRYYQKDFYLTSGSLCRSNSQGSTPCPSNEGYSESGTTWATSGTYKGYTQTLPTRYSCTTPGASAAWTETIPFAGTYAISAWVIVSTSSDPAAKYTISQNGAVVSTVTLNQTTGSTAWNLLNGSLTVAAGDVITVTVTGSGAGCVRADTVKLIRIS